MNKKGFTLIEVLIYVVIFSVIAGLATSALFLMTRIDQKQSASSEVTDQLNFVMQKIQYLVKESSNIETAAPNLLKLRMENSSQDPTCLTLVGGVIKLAQGPNLASPQNCTSTTSDLTNSHVVVDTFSLQKFSQYPGHDTISINLQLTYNSADPQSRIQRNLQSAIARVSAATFDSDLVPGASYNYNLGAIGAMWQKILMSDGSSAQPSYSFGNDSGLGIFRAASGILGFSTGGVERMRIDASGGITISSGGSAGHAICWKDGKTLGYCSTQPNTSGVCTCN